MSYKVTKVEVSPEKFQTFEDLDVYKTAREFRKAMENYLFAHEVANLKEQARQVLILINAYLRYFRSRSATVRESDGTESHVINELDELLAL